MHWGVDGNEENAPKFVTTQWAETVIIFKALQGSVELEKQS